MAQQAAGDSIAAGRRTMCAVGPLSAALLAASGEAVHYEVLVTLEDSSVKF